MIRSDPPNWRKIVEEMCGRLADWETDYEPEADRRCVEELHCMMEGFEEHWQDYTTWELYGCPRMNTDDERQSVYAEQRRRIQQFAQEHGMSDPYEGEDA